MRVKSKKNELVEPNLTPMIDMTFQLIAFFMVLINFTQTEAHEEIKLPSSQLVKPPDAPMDFPIILHVARDGRVFLGADEFTAETLNLGLRNEQYVLEADGKTNSDADLIIRAHRDTAAGEVQEVIRVAQDMGFVNFALRVKEDLGQ